MLFCPTVCSDITVFLSFFSCVPLHVSPLIGADPKFQTPGGRGVLHVAAAQGQVSCLTELIRAGAPKDLKDRAGVTALEVARARGQPGVVHQLMLSKWEDRAQGLHLSSYLDPGELFAHQKFDS